MKILSGADYELLSLQSLWSLGMSKADAAKLCMDRWPMDAENVQAECRGRGIALQVEDLTDFLRHKYERDCFADGEPLTATSVVWDRVDVNRLIAWALENGRGEPARKRQLGEILSVKEMLAGLRSEHQAERMLAGALLSHSLGAGCALAGEDPLDFEHIRAPALADLLDRAMAGEAAAVDELEGHIAREAPTRARKKEARR